MGQNDSQDKNIRKEATPGEAPPQKLSDDRRYFKAVSNYMANVLGIDRNAIDEMLARKVNARSVDALVSEAVARYFGFGPDANGIEYHVNKRLDRTVDEYVRETMDRTCRGWIDRAVQQKAEEIAGRTPAQPGTAMPPKQPNLELYQKAAYIGMPLLEKMVGDWIQANIPEPNKITFTVRLMPTSDEAICADIRGLTEETAGLLDPLREHPGRYRPIDRVCRVQEHGMKKLLAAMLGWPSVGRIVPDIYGLAAFPPEA